MRVGVLVGVLAGVMVVEAVMWLVLPAQAAKPEYATPLTLTGGVSKPSLKAEFLARFEKQCPGETQLQTNGQYPWADVLAYCQCQYQWMEQYLSDQDVRDMVFVSASTVAARKPRLANRIWVCSVQILEQKRGFVPVD